MGQQKLESARSNKLSLKQFAWYGFNITVGIPFLGSLAILANHTSSLNNDPPLALGWNIIWIFLIMGIVAGACAIAFAKLSRYHKQDSFGGAYVFARSALGRFVGFLVAFLNYIIMPLMLSNQVLMFIKANFDLNMATSDGTAQWWNGWTTHLGNWSSLTFDLMGLALSVVFALVAFFGAKIYKRASKYSLIIKWASGGFLILFGLISAVMFGKQNMASWNEGTTFSFGSFLTAFCACFYYFTGFEAFATAGKTVQDPEKNIGKGVLIVMGVATLFYISMIVIFMFAQEQFNQNISTGFWVDLSKKAPWLRWLLYAGPIIMIVSTIGMRGNTISQATIYGGTILKPMSDEGYISDRFQEENKDHFPVHAMKLHIIISLITIGVWLIIPDILVGVGIDANFININTIISASSIFYIMIYFLIVLSLYKFACERVIKINVIEWIIYPVILLILTVVFVYHFYDPLQKIFSGTLTGNKLMEKIIAMCVELGFLLACSLFIVIVYFVYYVPKYKKRIKTNPKIQQKMNYEFRILDGWSFVYGKLSIILNDFFKKDKNKHSKIAKEKMAKYNLWHDINAKKILDKSKKMVLNYELYSERIEQHNDKKGINNSKEIFKNNQEAIKFLASIQKKLTSNR